MFIIEVKVGGGILLEYIILRGVSNILAPSIFLNWAAV